MGGGVVVPEPLAASEVACARAIGVVPPPVGSLDGDGFSVGVLCVDAVPNAHTPGSRCGGGRAVGVLDPQRVREGAVLVRRCGCRCDASPFVAVDGALLGCVRGAHDTERGDGGDGGDGAMVVVMRFSSFIVPLPVVRLSCGPISNAAPLPLHSAGHLRLAAHLSFAVVQLGERQHSSVFRRHHAFYANRGACPDDAQCSPCKTCFS